MTNTLKQQDTANRAAESSSNAEFLRMSVITQGTASDILNARATKGEVSYLRHIASVQRDAFREINDSETE